MKNYFYLFCSLLLMACEKDEIKPRTNPQFSVAFIQDIDETGVEFAANIYDYGSVEILEYGFVYDMNSNPRVDRSELVKAEGRPDTFFSMKALHSMVKGQKYNVAAYIKTTESVVYSAIMTFVSEGSTGFVFEKFEMPEPLYFGDTITVWGKNMSRHPSLYQFFIQNAKADIIEVNEDNFKVKIPNVFVFPRAPDLPLDFQIKVADKILKISEKVKFKAPIFIIEPTNFDYIDTLTIRGQFLESNEVLIRYVANNTSYNIAPLLTTSEEIVFLPRVHFKSLEPEFTLTIRGETYSFKNFKINPTEIKAGQNFNQLLYSPFSIKVTNPNPYFPQIHRLYSPAISNLNLIPTRIEKGFITYQISSSSNGFYPRNLKLAINTLEHITDRIEFSANDAGLKYMGASLSIENSRGISHAGKGYLFLKEEIKVVDPTVRTIDKVATIPDSNHPAALFLIKHTTGKIYMGGYNRNGDRVLRSFDPVTKSVVLLGAIPSNVKNPKAAYVTDRYLYYEGTYSTYSFITNRYSDWEEAYRFDLQTSEWQKLDNENDHLGNFFYWRTFTFEGDLYTFRRDPSDGSLKIQRFDPSTERWQVLYTYSYNGDIFEVFVLGEFVYYNVQGSKYRVNLRNWEREKVSNINFYFSNHLSFQSGSKFYIYASPFFYEFDPEFFTY